MRIINNIRKYRLQKNLSQLELVDRINSCLAFGEKRTSKFRLQMYETGRAVPSRPELEAMARVLGYRPEALYEGYPSLTVDWKDNWRPEPRIVRPGIVRRWGKCGI
ncbi:MAG: helix-turn-helix transcriptional regulator [Firmicutes bacterium]|nr:helix-turn-helix transcriptional regulator [Bacillota bacterium]